MLKIISRTRAWNHFSTPSIKFKSPEDGKSKAQKTVKATRCSTEWATEKMGYYITPVLGEIKAYRFHFVEYTQRKTIQWSIDMTMSSVQESKIKTTNLSIFLTNPRNSITKHTKLQKRLTIIIIFINVTIKDNTPLAHSSNRVLPSCKGKMKIHVS